MCSKWGEHTGPPPIRGSLCSGPVCLCTGHPHSPALDNFKVLSEARGESLRQGFISQQGHCHHRHHLPLLPSRKERPQTHQSPTPRSHPTAEDQKKKLGSFVNLQGSGSCWALASAFALMVVLSPAKPQSPPVKWGWRDFPQRPESRLQNWRNVLPGSHQTGPVHVYCAAVVSNAFLAPSLQLH